MTLQAKELADKPVILKSIPAIHREKGKKQLWQVSSILSIHTASFNTGTCTLATYKQTHMHAKKMHFYK